MLLLPYLVAVGVLASLYVAVIMSHRTIPVATSMMAPTSLQMASTIGDSVGRDLLNASTTAPAVFVAHVSTAWRERPRIVPVAG